MTPTGTIHNVQPIVPNPNDVLCGAGNAVMRHPGNRAFRALVKESVQNYSESDKYMKAKIRKYIVGAVQASNGRFLKQRTDKSWCILSWDEAEGKTAQALRDGKRSIGRDNNADNVVPANDHQSLDNPMQTMSMSPSRRQPFISQDVQMPAGDNGSGGNTWDKMENLSIDDSGDVTMLSSQFASMLISLFSSTFSIHLSNESMLSLNDNDFILPSSCFSVSSAKKGTAPNESDVLCGSGKAIMNHPGNRKFREMVKAVVARSPDDPGYRKKEIVEAIKNNGGQFLKQISPGVWYPISDHEAMEKTSQALRDAKRLTLRQKSNEQTSDSSPQCDRTVSTPKPVEPCFILPSSTEKNAYDSTGAEVASGAEFTMPSFGTCFDDPSSELMFETSENMDSIVENLDNISWSKIIERNFLLDCPFNLHRVM